MKRALLLLLVLWTAGPARARERFVRVVPVPRSSRVTFYQADLPQGKLQAREVRLNGRTGEVAVQVTHPGYVPYRGELKLIRGRHQTGPGTWQFRVELVPDGLLSYLHHWFRYRPVPAYSATAAAALLLGLGGAFVRRAVLRGGDDLTGRSVDGYRLLELIGEGGFARVYRVKERSSGRIAAIKILKAEAHDYAERMQRESLIVGRLDHPRLARVWGSGVYDGRPYLVMECVQGVSLKERLKGGRMELQEALACTRQIAEGLAYAHHRGVLHRDLKPANVMLDNGGAVKLLDFGVARAADSQTLTVTGEMIGTPYYMAPEQMSKQADARADLYSLGVMLFQMLTGTLPFAGETVTFTITAHLVEPIPSVTQRQPSVPEAVDRLVQSLLAKRPQERIASADELLAELDRLGV